MRSNEHAAGRRGSTHWASSIRPSRRTITVPPGGTSRTRDASASNTVISGTRSEANATISSVR